jgi:hypothetical protein
MLQIDPVFGLVSYRVSRDLPVRPEKFILHCHFKQNLGWSSFARREPDLYLQITGAGLRSRIGQYEKIVILPVPRYATKCRAQLSPLMRINLF